MIHGVPEHDVLHPPVEEFHGVEQRCGVGPGRDENPPQMHDVAEEDGECADKQAQSSTENGHHHHQQRQAPERVDAGNHAEVNHNQGHGDKRNGEVDQFEQDFLDGEDHLLDADLLDKRLRVDDGAHGTRGAAVHEIEKNLAQDKVEREVLDVEAEHEREHGGKNDHHQQGIEYAPQHTQDAAAVFQFEIFADQGVQHEHIVLELALLVLFSRVFYDRGF